MILAVEFLLNWQTMGKLSSYSVNLCLLVLLSSAVLAQDKARPASEATAQVLVQAQKLLEEAKADEAIRILRSADHTTSNESEIAYLLGVAYHLKGDYVHAVE